MTESQARQLARDALPCPFCGERLVVMPCGLDWWVEHAPSDSCFNGHACVIAKSDLERWNRRAGPWCPPSARTPVSPCDCKHDRTLFVQGHRGVGKDYYECERVSVCQDCGTFLISRQQDNEHMRVQFTLPTWELVQAAGQYARLLSKEESK